MRAYIPCGKNGTDKDEDTRKNRKYNKLPGAHGKGNIIKDCYRSLANGIRFREITRVKIGLSIS